MTNDVQKQAEEIFHRVVELGESERDAYLETHCQDPAVRKEVDGLLAHSDHGQHTLTGAFSAELDRSSRDGDPEAGREGPTEVRSQSSAGRWESVLEVLAGGLGSVSQINLRDALGDESPVAVPLGRD